MIGIASRISALSRAVIRSALLATIVALEATRPHKPKRRKRRHTPEAYAPLISSEPVQVVEPSGGGSVLTAPQAEAVREIRSTISIHATRPRKAARYAAENHVTTTKAAQLHGCSVEAVRSAFAELYPETPRIAT